MENEKNSSTAVVNNVIEEHIPFKSKFSVSFADGMTATLSGLITGGGLLFFYQTYLGLDASFAYWVWIIYGIWNAVNDPLFGFITDHTHSKIGRRLPFIRYGAPLLALAFIMAWFPWTGGEAVVAGVDAVNNPVQWTLFWQMLLTLFLFDTMYTAIASALYVMPFEMCVTNKARSGIIIWKLVFALISMGVPLVMLPMLESAFLDPLSASYSLATFQWVMVGIAVVSAIIIWGSTYFYKENGYTQVEQQMGFFKSIGYCFKNKSFVLFEVISWTVIFAQTVLMAGIVYYLTAYTEINSMFMYGGLVLGAIAGIAVYLTTMSKFGLKKEMIIMCAAFAGGLLIVLALGYTNIGIALGMFFIGVGFAGGMYLIPLLNGDVIDYDESKTGLRREGMYAGVNSLVTKPAISAAAITFTAVMGWFGITINKFADTMNVTNRYGVIVAWVGFAAILVILSLVAMIFNPLHGKEWENEKNRLALVHQEKQTKFEQAVLAREIKASAEGIDPKDIELNISEVEVEEPQYRENKNDK